MEKRDPGTRGSRESESAAKGTKGRDQVSAIRKAQSSSGSSGLVGHTCLIFSGRKEIREKVPAFVEEGVAFGRRILWVGHRETPESIQILGPHAPAEGDAAGPLRAQFKATNACFHRNGRFDQRHALASVRDEILRARADGLEGLHLIHELDASQETAGGLMEVIAFEAGLNEILRSQPCSVLCLHDRSRTPPLLLLGSLDSHPLLLRQDSTRVPNPYFRPHLEPEGVRGDGVVDQPMRLLEGLPGDGGSSTTAPVDPLLSKVLQIVSSHGSSSHDLLENALEQFGRHLGASSGRAYLVPRVGNRLQPCGTWVDSGRDRRPPAPLGGLRPISRGEGIAGRAWATRRVARTGEASPGWGTSTGELGGRETAMAIPLLAGDFVQAVLELASEEPMAAGNSVLAEARNAARSLGEVLGRIRAEEELAETRGGLEALLRELSGARETHSRARILELVMSSAREPMAITTADFRDGGPVIELANTAFCRAMGYAGREISGRSFRALWGRSTDPLVLDRMWEGVSRGERISTELIATRKDGDEFLAHLELTPVRASSGSVSHFIATQADVTREMVIEQLLTRADHDPLTRIAHRSVFTKMLRRAIERVAKSRDLRFAALFLDLNDFKQVNDTYGHLTGDQLLASVAGRLEEAIRPGDMLARFGGDEFVILLELVGSLDDVLAVVERIQERVDRPFQIGGQELRITTSIGIALSETGYSTVEEVLRDADSAMYRAKKEGEGGGSTYRIFDRVLQEQAASARRVRSELDGSLDRDEFRLHYQPLIDLTTDRIIGLEVLLRWDHPKRGLIPAAEFISQAEDLELILPIGRWVARKACRQLRVWQERFRPPSPLILSVNLSSRELVDRRLKDWLLESLVDEGADPASLRIEIPETFFGLRRAEVEGALEPLSDLGIRIGVDNFGSGSLPLGDIHRFPLEFLKIAPHYVADLAPRGGPGAGGGGAVRSILAVADSLGLKVVAEGVETSEQEARLRALSCPMAQGYLFSEPVAPERVEQLLQIAGNGASGANGVKETNGTNGRGREG